MIHIRKNFAALTTLATFKTGTMALLATVVVSGAVAGGCKKNDKPANKTGSAAKVGDKPGATEGTPAAAGGTKTMAVANGDDLAYLPAASDVIAQIDLAKLRGSALYKSFLEPKLREALEKEGKFAQFKSKCGMDPVAELTSISIGMTGSDDPQGVVIVHGMDKAKSLACLEKTKAEMEAEGSKYTIDGEIITVTTKDGKTSVMTFIDANSAVLQMGPAVSKDTLAAVLTGTAGVKSSAAFMDLYGKTKAGTVRFLVNGNMKQLQSNPMGIKPKAVFGSIDITDGLGVTVAARLSSDAEATQLAATLNGQVAQAKAFVTKADVTADGSDVRLDVAMSSEQMTALAGMAGGFMR